MDCGEDYLEINGVKKCGAMTLESLLNIMNVELAEAGESVEFHLKNTNPQVSTMLLIYTAAEPKPLDPHESRSYSENTYKNFMELLQ